MRKFTYIFFICLGLLSVKASVTSETKSEIDYRTKNNGSPEEFGRHKQENNSNIYDRRDNETVTIMRGSESTESGEVYDETSTTKQYDNINDFDDLNSPHSGSGYVYGEPPTTALEVLVSSHKEKEILRENQSERGNSAGKTPSLDTTFVNTNVKDEKQSGILTNILPDFQLQNHEEGINIDLNISSVGILVDSLSTEPQYGEIQPIDVSKTTEFLKAHETEEIKPKTSDQVKNEDDYVFVPAKTPEESVYQTLVTNHTPKQGLLDVNISMERLMATETEEEEEQIEYKSLQGQTSELENVEYFDDVDLATTDTTSSLSVTYNKIENVPTSYSRSNGDISDSFLPPKVPPTRYVQGSTEPEVSKTITFVNTEPNLRETREVYFTSEPFGSHPLAPSFGDIVAQPFHGFKDKSEEDKEALDSLLKVHPSFTKEKIEPGVLFEDCPDCDMRILPIKPSEQRSTSQDEEVLPPSKIKFADLPEGRELQINTLGLSDGIFVFSYISEFLSWIQPNDFPVELLREVLKNQLSWISLITQSLQVEAGFVACLVAGILLALAVPVVVLSHACYRLRDRSDDNAEDYGWAGNCRRRTLVFILQILLVLLCAGMLAMFATNEQLSSAVMDSGNVIQTSLSDVSSFVHNTQLQLHFLLVHSLDQTLQAVYADLDNVDTLLGRPIQRELVRETGLDVAIDSLGDLTREAKSITQQVERFLEEARIAQEMLVSARDKLTDLRQQVELFRRACGPRDRALCDTMDTSGLEVTVRLDRVKSDERLTRMKRMGGVGLELAAAEAKEHFLSVPARVETNTRDAREEVRRQLTKLRAEVDDQTVGLERLSRDMTTRVNDVRYEAGALLQDLDQVEYWRWIVCLGGGVAVLLIFTMLLCSMCCGCCGSEKAAGPTILLTIVLVCLFSTILWTIVLLGLVVGGHSEVFLCRPLHDEPDFHVLSRLVDQPGVFYSHPSGGFIANVIYGNDSIDVPIKQLLQDCRDNRPVYPALGLHRVLDLEGAVSGARWSSVTSRLRGVKANLSSLEVLSPALTDQLGDLLATLNVNFTEHRIQISKPVTGKDLDSFARQLDNIGNQLRDLATASRMETLTSRTRRVIETYIRPLEAKKDVLVYQLTALEVQTQPLQRQVNQSLSHLKTIQFFINSQGDTIAQRKSREYVERLLSYVDQLRDHVTSSARDRVSPCRPLWDIFNNDRLFLCRHTVDPINGYWFATMWCLLVLLAATPVCLKLVDYYRAQGNRTHGSPLDNLMVSEQSAGWSSPGYDIKCSKGGNEYTT